MATVYGSLVNSVFRSYMTYDITTTNSSVSVSIKSGLNIPSSGYQTSRSFESVISGTGKSNVSGSLSYGTYKGTLTKQITSTTYTFTRTRSAQTASLSAVLSANGVSTTSTASASVSIPAKPSYTVTYNANSGSGAPSSQTKWYGETLSLSSATPTRTGYTFAGWNTNASGTGTNYSAGGSYTGNAALTLYAKWTPITYSVTFNANGGSGSMSDQTMTYDTATTLTANAFSRANYLFKGWATSSGGTVAYSDEQSVKNLRSSSGTVNLYAIWESMFTSPNIVNITAFRVTKKTTNSDDTGTHGYISIQLKSALKKTTLDGTPAAVATTVAVQYKEHDNGTWTSVTSVSPSTVTSDTVTTVVARIGSASINTDLIDADYQYDIRVVATADPVSSTKTSFISKAEFTFDVAPDGKSFAFFEAAEEGLDRVMRVNGEIRTVDLNLELDSTAGSGTDHDLIAALTALGWDDLLS